ncbi:uncharacterized protein LOC130777079 [Actinidia eriantha]|uniref:uncharacterized protein LOC130777079 n=1 Tax=Actinidia eriantha TaxID=165200 RepID=UPI0025884933|nr:uncharacterized protein LOC130777079 [Actinidia eriantha]
MIHQISTQSIRDPSSPNRNRLLENNLPPRSFYASFLFASQSSLGLLTLSLSAITVTKMRKLNCPTGHQISMPKTMVSQLVKHERIETTVSKAKEIRRLADNMVQHGKEVYR